MFEEKNENQMETRLKIETKKKTKRKSKVGKGGGEEDKRAQSELLRSHGALRGSG